MRKVLKNNFMMLKYIFQFCPSHILFTSLISILENINSVINILYLRYIVNTLSMSSSLQVKNIIIIILIMLAFNLSFMLISATINQWITPRNIQIISRKMQEMIINKIMEIDYECYDNSKFYDKFSIASQQSDNRAIAVLDTFSSIIGSLFGISALTVLIGTFDIFILILVFINVIVNTIINFKTSRIMHDYYEERMIYVRKLDYVKRIFYLNFYAKEIRMFVDLKKLMIKKFIHFSDLSISLLRKFSKKMLNKIKIGAFTSTLTSSSIIIILAIKVISKKIKLGDFIALSNGSSQLIFQMTKIVSAIPNLYEHSIYIENFNDFMNYVPKIKNISNPLSFPDNFVIKINNVSFKYPDTASLALRNINLTLKKGQNIALVGINGSGKTTLIKLLCRLYDPTNGSIEMNDIPYTNYDIKSIRNNIGVVFQDLQIYALTIAENVLMRPITDINVDTKIVISALEKVGLYEKIKKLEKGIFTNITKEFDSEGAIFSGGEYQKLIISRIYAKNSSLIILDEPSSSLDAFAEQEMYDSIINSNKDKSIIFITHRLSNVQKVNKIYYLEEGNIIESGSHSELYKKRGKYYHLFYTQAHGYQ